MKKPTYGEILMFVVGLGFGVVFVDWYYVEYDNKIQDSIDAMELCQSQVPENVTCRITAIPYEATVRLGQ